jgi:Ca-activated chloride channel family protein
MVKIPDELNEDELLSIANATGGQYFRATNYKELSSIYAEIDKLEKSDVTRPPILSYTDHHDWALVPALLMLLAMTALSETFLARIP